MALSPLTAALAPKLLMIKTQTIPFYRERYRLLDANFMISKRFLVSALFVLTCYASLAQSLPMRLQGSSQDSTIEHVHIGDFSPFWKHFVRPKLLVEENIRPDHTFDIQFEVDRPTPISFIILGATASIYASPGDSVNFTIVQEEGRPKVTFTGKNAAYYNFKLRLDEVANPRESYPVYAEGKDIEAYKAAIDNWYRLKANFLVQYLQEHNLSGDFARYAEEEIQSDYLYLLYRPIGEGFVKHEKLPADYFSLGDTFGKPNENQPFFSKTRMNALTYQYILAHKDNPWENFDTIYSNIKQNFRGRVREHLIANLIGVYAKKQLQNYRPSLEKAIQEVPNYVSDANCLSYITQCANQYLLLDQPLPQELLTNTYLRSYKDSKKITMASVFEKYKGKAIYIDFWASWCTPCIHDIVNSAEARQYLESQQVKYVFVSLDTKANTDKWLKISSKYGIIQDQYLLADDFSSKLAKHLSLSFIPRYLILNQEHDVKNIDAPHPTSEEIEKLKKSIMEIK